MKIIARILEVVTSPVSGEQYVTACGGTFETVNIDGRWGAEQTRMEVQEQIEKRIKSGILKQDAGYALYRSGSGGLRLIKANIPFNLSQLPTKFL